MSTLRPFLIIAMLSLASNAAFAQQATLPTSTTGLHSNDISNDEQTIPRRNSAISEKKREEIRKKIEVIRIWRLTEVLKLDTDTGAKLTSLLSSMDLKRKDVMKDYTQAMKDLRVYVESAKPDESKIKMVLNTIEKKHHDMEDIRDQELNGLRNILTVEQQGRFLLFQHEFNREMRKMLAGARGPAKVKGAQERGGGRLPNAGTGSQQDK
jgi:hypothetical protein